VLSAVAGAGGGITLRVGGRILSLRNAETGQQSALEALNIATAHLRGDRTELAWLAGWNEACLLFVGTPLPLLGHPLAPETLQPAAARRLCAQC
jgi:hypothetical protein